MKLAEFIISDLSRSNKVQFIIGYILHKLIIFHRKHITQRLWRIPFISLYGCQVTKQRILSNYCKFHIHCNLFTSISLKKKNINAKLSFGVDLSCGQNESFCLRFVRYVQLLLAVACKRKYPD